MSCLFNSIGQLVGEDPTRLRHLICDYLGTHPGIWEGESIDTVVRWTSDMKLADYVAGMRSTSTWGGALEIRAYTEITGYGVVVHNLMDGKTIEFVPSRRNAGHRRTLHISWNGCHYEPLRMD
jgi:hypothetical protein